MPIEQRPGRRRIVVATAEPIVARIIGHKLGREGHDILTVGDAKHLGDALDAGMVDVAVVDLELAEDCLTTTIAASVRCGWLAIVDGREHQAAEHAMTLGAAGLVRTPFKPTEVAAQVATLLTMATA